MRLSRIFAAAGLAAAVLAVAAGAATAATLKAPTIKESFTPLTCTHDGTTLGDEGCAEQKIVKSDKQIDALNAQIFAKLSTSSAKKDFISAHRAWFKYREAYCLSESDVFQGGTEAGILDANCAVDVNTDHVKKLKGFLADLKERG